jgi:hypothetical protein
MDGHHVAKTFFAGMNEGWIREKKPAQKEM